MTENAKNQTSEDLLARLRSGDESAVALLVDRFQGAMTLFATKRTDKNAAPDLVQEAFAIAVNKIKAGEPRDPAHLPSFLRFTLVSVITSNIRIKKRREVNEKDVSAQDKTSDFATLDDWNESAVQSVVSEVTSGRDNTILRAYYLEETPKSKICADLKITAAHLDRVLYRAKRKLRQLLDSDEADGLVSPQVESRGTVKDGDIERYVSSAMTEVEQREFEEVLFADNVVRENTDFALVLREAAMQVSKPQTPQKRPGRTDGSEKK